MYLTYRRGTNLVDGGHFQAHSRQEIERARRRNEQFTIVFLDVDNFKRTNDTYGHRIGDEFLKLVADALRSKARQTDAVARQGGDELTVLLAGAPLPEAQNLFGRLREEAAEYSEHELGFRLSLSAGAASFPSDAGDPDGLLEAADAAMYRAKRWGKDRLYYRFMDTG